MTGAITSVDNVFGILVGFSEKQLPFRSFRRPNVEIKELLKGRFRGRQS
jgi:hypothetical protein